MFSSVASSILLSFRQLYCSIYVQIDFMGATQEDTYMRAYYRGEKLPGKHNLLKVPTYK